MGYGIVVGCDDREVRRLRPPGRPVRRCERLVGAIGVCTC